VKGIDEVFFWYPIAPPGYVSLGCVVSRLDEPPRLDLFCCPRMDLVSQANIHEVPLSRSSSSKSPQCWSIWKVENQVKHDIQFTWLTLKNYFLLKALFMCGIKKWQLFLEFGFGSKFPHLALLSLARGYCSR